MPPLPHLALPAAFHLVNVMFIVNEVKQQVGNQDVRLNTSGAGHPSSPHDKPMRLPVICQAEDMGLNSVKLGKAGRKGWLGLWIHRQAVL